MRFLLLPLLLLALFPLASPHGASAQQPDVQGLLERISPSIGALYARTANGDMNFLCSATAIGTHENHTIILSAEHCLEKGVAYIINFGDGILRPAQVWKIPHYEVDPDKNKRAYNEPATDMALFLTKGTDIPTLDLAGNTDDVVPGSEIVMVGFPLGVAKISYSGIVAGRLDMPGNDHDGYLLLQVFGAPGSSGSSVVDASTGKIIGVLVSAKQASVGLPVIFGTPVEYGRYLAEVRRTTAVE